MKSKDFEWLTDKFMLYCCPLTQKAGSCIYARSFQPVRHTGGNPCIRDYPQLLQNALYPQYWTSSIGGTRLYLLPV